MDLFSQEWSHLKDMLSVLLTMSNFPYFNAQRTLRNKFSLCFLKRTTTYHPKIVPLASFTKLSLPILVIPNPAHFFKKKIIILRMPSHS